jgi:hypothetical protein
MKKRMLAGALALSLLATSCLGPDNLFNGLHEWNKKATDGKWGNEIIFVAFTIIPVYGFAWLGDVIIFNSFEFWGGKNPIEPPAKS